MSLIPVEPLRRSTTQEKLFRFALTPWFQAPYRILQAVLLLFLGVYIRRPRAEGEPLLDATAGFLLFAFVLVFGLLELVFAKSRKDIEDEADTRARMRVDDELKAAGETRRALEFRLSLDSSAVEYLAVGIQRSMRGFDKLTSSVKDELPNLRSERIKKIATIEDALRSLCNSLRLAAQRRNPDVLIPDVSFRATYMEIKPLEWVNGGGEHDVRKEKRLVYLAWATPGMHPPRSKSEYHSVYSVPGHGVAYPKGKGCAGIAWERSRPVIEDKFKHDHEWVQNYNGQSELYKSMVCVPVKRSNYDGKEMVIGVITIDTGIENFFGEKDCKKDEELVGSWVTPYADYIALVSVFDEGIKALQDLFQAQTEETILTKLGVPMGM